MRRKRKLMENKRTASWDMARGRRGMSARGGARAPSVNSTKAMEVKGGAAVWGSDAGTRRGSGSAGLTYGGEMSGPIERAKDVSLMLLDGIERLQTHAFEINRIMRDYMEYIDDEQEELISEALRPSTDDDSDDESQVGQKTLTPAKCA